MDYETEIRALGLFCAQAPLTTHAHVIAAWHARADWYARILSGLASDDALTTLRRQSAEIAALVPPDKGDLYWSAQSETHARIVRREEFLANQRAALEEVNTAACVRFNAATPAGPLPWEPDFRPMHYAQGLYWPTLHEGSD